MDFFSEYGEVIAQLYEMSNPVIKYRIDKELYGKTDIKIDQYVSLEDDIIKYWLNAFKTNSVFISKEISNLNNIHGSRDNTFESTISKLLQFGFSREDSEFTDQFNFLLDDKYWKDNNSFAGMLIKTVLYPFLIHAGYGDDANIEKCFVDRLEIVESTIEKYGYDLEDTKLKKTGKYENAYVLRYNLMESLPTIYDLYAYAFYSGKDNDISRRIENVIQYLLDDRFQQIPNNAYLYDGTGKRYYAVGKVYQGCLVEQRKLLYLYLLSNFKAAGESDLFNNQLNGLLSTRLPDGFFEFDKDLMKEQKNKYHMYSGSHMGLGEKRRGKSWVKIESTFWMLKILFNMENSLKQSELLSVKC